MPGTHSVHLLPESSWRARAYQLLRRLAKLPLPGLWRLQKLGKHAVGSRYVQIDNGAFRMWVCPSHLSGLQVIGDDQPERLLLEVVRHFAVSGASFIDIGANIGMVTVEAGRAIRPGQRVLAFEPEPGMFQVLRANCELNGARAELHSFALGSEECEAELFVSTTGNQGNHSLFSRPGTKSPERCRVATLDTTLDRDFVPSMVLLKIDVEGAEPRVLHGGRSWLGQREELAILIEVCPGNLERAGSSAAELDRLFERLGIAEMFLLDERDRSLDPIDSLDSLDREWANVLALKGERSRSTAEAFARGLETASRPSN